MEVNDFGIKFLKPLDILLVREGDLKIASFLTRT